MVMEFHAGIGRYETVPEIADLARVAEESGFSHVSLPDQPLLNRDVFVGMAAAALNTRRIRVGPGVTDPHTYHPVLIANATASVDELSGGRAFAGIGAGGRWGKEMKPISLREFREAARFLKTFMTGAEAEFNGVRMHSDWIRQPVPLYIAVNGPRGHAIAGEFADGVYIQSVHPVVVKWRMELIERAAVTAGRDPSTIVVLPSANIYVTDSKDKARHEVASQVASKLRYVTWMWRKDVPETADLHRRLERADHGLLDELYRVRNQVIELWDDHQHERTDAPHARPVTQRLIDYFLLVGTAEEIGERLAGLRELGIRGVLALMYTFVDPAGMIREIGKSIIPRFAR
jgi:5,10-methylenetetrahydromethanopterin reductase